MLMCSLTRPEPPTQLHVSNDRPAPFWETTPLSEMTREQWESLCDGCGRCCLLRLEDEDTGQVHTTVVACRLLDLETCRCSDYDRRFSIVPLCLRMTPERAADWGWLPETCAYVRVARGEGLADWHPLVSGDSESVHEAGISVRGRVLSEAEVDEDSLPYLLAD